MVKTTLQFLKEARKVIESPDNWCQEMFAQNKDGKPIASWHQDATKFCAVGALYRVSPFNYDSKLYEKTDSDSFVLRENHNNTFNQLQAKSSQLYGKLVQSVNDSMSHSDVLKIYDETIKELDEKEKLASSNQSISGQTAEQTVVPQDPNTSK